MCSLQLKLTLCIGWHTDGSVDVTGGQIVFVSAAAIWEMPEGARNRRNCDNTTTELYLVKTAARLRKPSEPNRSINP